MNFVAIYGRLTAKPELRETTSQKKYARFSVAVKRDKEETDFINCVAWNKTAETIAKYFDKGSPIIVNGSIRTSSYEKDGIKKTSTDILVNEFEFVSGKKEDKPKSDNYDPFADFGDTVTIDDNILE